MLLLLADSNQNQDQEDLMVAAGGRLAPGVGYQRWPGCPVPQRVPQQIYRPKRLRCVKNPFQGGVQLCCHADLFPLRGHCSRSLMMSISPRREVLNGRTLSMCRGFRPPPVRPSLDRPPWKTRLKRRY